MAANALGQIRVGLIQFPGSNCDADVVSALKRHYGIDVQLIWHQEANLPKVDALVLPGGFSYGDYLRGGALASHAPLMNEVKAFAKAGRPIIGICNGFQMLTETALLPGALLRNAHRHFVCEFVDLKVAGGPQPYRKRFQQEPWRIPVAHGEGRYYIDDDGLKSLQDKDQIVFTYEKNPNGSVADIAGITSADGRILGLMPHPERAMDEVLAPAAHGRLIWDAFFENCL